MIDSKNARYCDRVYVIVEDDKTKEPYTVIRAKVVAISGREALICTDGTMGLSDLFNKVRCKQRTLDFLSVVLAEDCYLSG